MVTSSASSLLSIREVEVAIVAWLPQQHAQKHARLSDHAAPFLMLSIT